MPTRFAPASIVSLAILCTSVALSGCAQPDTSTPFLTSRGVRVQSEPPTRPVGGVAGPFDGLYQGPANAMFTGGGTCPGMQPVTDFHVTNSVAQWSGYSGRIDPNGRVEMHHGFEFMTGTFRGNRFVGRLETGAYGRGPSCVYVFNLRRTGI